MPRIIKFLKGDKKRFFLNKRLDNLLQFDKSHTLKSLKNKRNIIMIIYPSL